MPFHTIPDTDIEYGLLSYDASGLERTDDRDGLMSQRLLEAAADKDISNIFLFSHGWRGDARDAIAQYDLWIKAVDEHQQDRQRAEQVFPGFRPLYIGLHWPSEPWGDEELTGDHFAPGEGLGPEALQALGLGSGGLEAGPDADREAFDPDAAFETANSEAADFGLFDSLGGLLAPLRPLSYWTMKKRARTIGEGGMHSFMKALQQATADKGTRIHLMGHSFGCIVVSSILGGPEGKGPLERPLDSTVLVQGAVSLWSYSPDIPISPGKAGYFHRILPERKVRGPLVTTQSRALRHCRPGSCPRDLASGFCVGVGVGRNKRSAVPAMPRFTEC